MRQMAPRREQMNRVQWFNDRRNGKDIFRLRMPKITERNGRICCLRVVVVRMKDGMSHDQLPGINFFGPHNVRIISKFTDTPPENP